MHSSDHLQAFEARGLEGQVQRLVRRPSGHPGGLRHPPVAVQVLPRTSRGWVVGALWGQHSSRLHPGHHHGQCAGDWKRYLQFKYLVLLCPQNPAKNENILYWVLLSLIIFLQVPFESILDVEKFTVRILQKDIPRIIDIITAIPDSKVEEMRSNVDKVWQRYDL